MNQLGNNPTPIPLWPEGSPNAPAEDPPRLTPSFAAGPGPHAAIIVCPGGGYGRRNPTVRAPAINWLNDLGISAFILDYRVKPHRHPGPLRDVQRAIRMVRARAAEWRIDPERVGLLGFSAGGHVAACASVFFDNKAPHLRAMPPSDDPLDCLDSRPDAAILCYPVITFLTHAHQGSMNNLLGKDPAPDRALREQLSAELHVRSDTPPTFIWHTADDQTVPVENALLYAGALARKRVPFALHAFASGRHGLAFAPELPHINIWTTLAANWLRDLGFTAA